jgi:hypothetical protein
MEAVLGECCEALTKGGIRISFDRVDVVIPNGHYSGGWPPLHLSFSVPLRSVGAPILIAGFAKGWASVPASDTPSPKPITIKDSALLA